MQTRCMGQKILDRIAAMNLAIIQQDNEMTPYLSQELAEECRHFFPLDIVLKK